MLHPTGRLIAFAILHQSYSSQPVNPYVPLLLNAACDETSEKSERVFVQLLLMSANGNNNNEVLQQSAVDYINGPVSASQALLPREQLEKQYCGNSVQPQPQASTFRSATVRCALPDPDIPQSCANSSEISPPGSKQESASDDRESALSALLQEKSWGRLGPQWIRPTPPRLHILDGELQWLNPDNTHELLWDYSMCADTSRGAAIRDLIARALKGPLGPGQQEVSCSILLFVPCQFKPGRNGCFDKYLGSFNNLVRFFHSLEPFSFSLVLHIYLHVKIFSYGTSLICSQLFSASCYRIGKGL
jgi:hypothetical protein